MHCPNVVAQICTHGAMYEDSCADCGCALILHDRKTGRCCLHSAVEEATKEE
jgi:hypothetical protein